MKKEIRNEEEKRILEKEERRRRRGNMKLCIAKKRFLKNG